MKRNARQADIGEGKELRFPSPRPDCGTASARQGVLGKRVFSAGLCSPAQRGVSRPQKIFLFPALHLDPARAAGSSFRTAIAYSSQGSFNNFRLKQDVCLASSQPLA